MTTVTVPARAWGMLVAISTIYLLNSGFAYYGASVLNAVMAQELAISRGTLGAGFTVMLLVQGLAGPAIAASMQRFGLRSTITAGTLLLAFGTLSMSLWVHGPWSYLFAFGLAVGLGTGLSTYIPSQTLVAQWFDRHRAVAFSVVMASGGVGGFLIAPLFGALLSENGGAWRAGWGIATAFVLSMALLSWTVIRDRPVLPKATSGENAADRNTAAPGDGWTAARLLRMPALWIMVLGDLAVGMPIMCVLAHGIAHLRDIGFTPTQAAAAIGLMSLSGLGGKLLAGVLGERIAARYLWSASCAVVGIGMLLSVQANSLVLIYAFSVVLGIGYGAGLVCKSTMVGEYFGAAAFGKVMGTMAPVSICLTALSPYLVGLSWDWRSSYVPAFTALTVLGFLAAFALLFARKPGAQPQRHDTAAVAGS